MSKTLYLYLFYNVLIDYTSGIAGVIASSKKEAINKIINQYTMDEKILINYNKKYENYMKKYKKKYENNYEKYTKYHEKFIKEHKLNVFNHTGTVGTTLSSFKKELQSCKSIVKLPLTTDYGFYIGGSG